MWIKKFYNIDYWRQCYQLFNPHQWHSGQVRQCLPSRISSQVQYFGPRPGPCWVERYVPFKGKPSSSPTSLRLGDLVVLLRASTLTYLSRALFDMDKKVFITLTTGIKVINFFPQSVMLRASKAVLTIKNKQPSPIFWTKARALLSGALFTLQR